MASEDFADDERDEPTTGVKRLPSVIAARAGNLSPLEPAAASPVAEELYDATDAEAEESGTLTRTVASPWGTDVPEGGGPPPGSRPEPVPEIKRRLEPQTGKTLISQPLPEPVRATHRLEPQTGKTLVSQPLPEPVRATHRLEPQTGKTLVNQPLPEPVRATHRLEPQTGKTLVNQPIPEVAPVVSHHLEPRTGRTLFSRPIPEPPSPAGLGSVVLPRVPEVDLPLPPAAESSRLAGRCAPPASVPRSSRWVGGYEVLARLRRTPRGTEYLCRAGDDPQARHALTVLRCQLSTVADRAAFLRDANRLAELAHPGLLELVDAGVHQQQPYLVRPRSEGLTLAQLLAATPASARIPEVVLRIFEDVLEALVHLHQPRVICGQAVRFVHGALTADELFVSTSGRTLVTGVGEAPFLGLAPADPSRDLLALGILLDSALAGGLDEQLLQARWLEHARAGRSACVADLLREYRRDKPRAAAVAHMEEVAAWVAGASGAVRVRPSTPSGSDSLPALSPEALPAPPRLRWLTTLRSWLTRRRR